MKKRTMTKTLALLLLLARLQVLCAQENKKSPRELPQTQKSESEESLQTVTSEQLEQIYEVIDDMQDQWILEVQEKEEKIFSLKKQRRFWIKVSVCEALVIAASAYYIHNFNKQ